MKPVFVALVSVTFILLCQPCSAQLTPRQQKNLTAFTRLYGYVRYFHPSDEAATLDWDGFAIYGAGKILEARDDQTLISELKELFHPVAPSVIIYIDGDKYKFSRASITPPDTGNYKPVAWQHFGVGINDNQLYKSIRINRPELQKAKTTQSFAPFGEHLSAEKIRGKEFRFSGWMKVDSTQGGAGHFWMRVEKKGQVVYFYNMDNRPVTSGTWREYTFTGQADKDADTIVLGAFLMGKGSLLVDNIRLSVKDNGGWKDIPVENGGFEKDNSSPVNGWSYNHKLAGYRYATETTDVREGAKAFSVSSIQEKNTAKGPVAKPLYTHYPKPGEYIQTALAPGISCIVPLALFGTDEHTFPAGNMATLSRLQQNVRAATPSAVNGDSLAVRLGDVVICWNIFRHFFAYWDDASLTPGKLLDKALAKAATDRTRYDFLETLGLMTAPLNDGHIYIYMQGDTNQRAFAPLTFTMVGGQLVVEQVLDSSLRTSLSPGDVVSAVNGWPATAYISHLDQTVSGSPQLKEFRDLANIPLGPRDSSLTLVVRSGGSEHTVNVRRYQGWKAWTDAQPQKTPSGWIRPGIFFIDIGRDPMDSINAWMPRLQQAKAIICDLRGYPKNNHELIRHFLDSGEDTKWMFVPQVTYPDYQHIDYQGMGWQMTPATPRLTGKIFFLTHGNAISYAESYMGFIKDFHLATIVGQPTAGTNGNINPFVLPGGYHISFTGMLVKDHNGGKHHLKGIVPDVPVERTLEGIRANRDEFLDKAIELAGK